jgi:hypothetical protein
VLRGIIHGQVVTGESNHFDQNSGCNYKAKHKKLEEPAFSAADEIPAADSERKLGIVLRGGLNALQMFFLCTKL